MEPPFLLATPDQIALEIKKIGLKGEFLRSAISLYKTCNFIFVDIVQKSRRPKR